MPVLMAAILKKRHFASEDSGRFLGSYLGHPIYCNPAKMASVGIYSFVLVYDPYYQSAHVKFRE